MRIYEIISNNTVSKIFNVRSIFGGGKITLSVTTDYNGKLISLTNEFLDKDNKLIVKYTIKNNKQYWYDKQNINGQLFHPNTSPVEMMQQFIKITMDVMVDFYEKELLSKDSKGDRTLAISKKIGKITSMKENKDIQDIKKIIENDLKEFINLSLWAAKNINKKVDIPSNFQIKENTKNIPNK